MEKAIRLIAEDLKFFEEYFAGAVKSKAPLLDRIMQYIVKRKGKQLRPMFIFLNAQDMGKKNCGVYAATTYFYLSLPKFCGIK